MKKDNSLTVSALSHLAKIYANAIEEYKNMEKCLADYRKCDDKADWALEHFGTEYVELMDDRGFEGLAEDCKSVMTDDIIEMRMVETLVERNIMYDWMKDKSVWSFKWMMMVGDIRDKVNAKR